MYYNFFTSFLGQRPIISSFMQAGFTSSAQPKPPAHCTFSVTPSTSMDFGEPASSNQKLHSPPLATPTGALPHEF